MASLVLSHPWRDEDDKLHQPGERVEVDDATAKVMVQDGAGLYATQTEAKKAGADPSEAASARK